jgi:hypothetical protein
VPTFCFIRGGRFLVPSLEVILFFFPKCTLFFLHLCDTSFGLNTGSFPSIVSRAGEFLLLFPFCDSSPVLFFCTC